MKNYVFNQIMSEGNIVVTNLYDEEILLKTKSYLFKEIQKCLSSVCMTIKSNDYYNDKIKEDEVYVNYGKYRNEEIRSIFTLQIGFSENLKGCKCSHKSIKDFDKCFSQISTRSKSCVVCFHPSGVINYVNIQFSTDNENDDEIIKLLKIIEDSSKGYFENKPFEGTRTD